MTLCLLLFGVTTSWAVDVIDNALTSGNLADVGTTAWADFSVTCSSGAQFVIHSMGTKGNSNALQWNKNGYLYQTVSGGILKRVTIKGTAKKVNIFASNEAYSNKASGTAIATLTCSSTGATYNFNDEYKFLAINGAESSTAIESITIEYDNGVVKTQAYLRWASSGDKEYYIGQTLNNTAKLYDAESGGNEIKDVQIDYSSSNESCATVDAKGNVTPLKAGYANITASLTSDTYKASDISYKATAAWKYTTTPTITAVCVGDGYLRSEDNTFSGKINITIARTPDMAMLYYTTDGSDPRTSATRLSSAAESVVIENIETAITVKAVFADAEGCLGYTKTNEYKHIDGTICSIVWNLCGKEISEKYFSGETLKIQQVLAPTNYGFSADYEFVGWSNSNEIPSDGTGFVAIVGGAPVIADATYYAYFAKKSVSSEPSLVKMAKGDRLEDGDKIVIVAHDTDVALYRETVSTSYVNKYTFDNDAEKVITNNKNYVPVNEVTGGFTLGDYADGFLYNSANYLYCGNTDCIWTLQDMGDGTFKLLTDNRYLSYRSDLSSNYWRMGGASKGTNGQTALDLYKLETGEIGYDNYCMVATTFTRSELEVNSLGTICLACDATITGAKAYEISSMTMNGEDISSITFSAVDKVEGGKGYLFVASGSELTAEYISEAKTEDDNNNGLVGSLEGTDVAEGKYIINNNKVKKCGTDCKIAANRAYIDPAKYVGELSAKGETITIELETPTSINELMQKVTAPGQWYNLNGQPVAQPTKGVFTKNGVKYIFK